jgi:hypothetical protein
MSDYILGDARKTHVTDAAVACVDLAWARPQRNGVHVTYPTYKPENGLWEFVDAVHESLQDGGWAFFDADDWLLPRLIQYLQDSWGDVAATYRGGGYRRTGTVVYEGHPGGGHYFTNGGYHVVMAHKGETERESSTSAKQVTERVPREVRREVDWGTLKPISPYTEWIESVTDPGELVYVPCAGTAPAAIAAESLGREWVAVDSEPEARDAFSRRRDLQVNPQQATL